MLGGVRGLGLQGRDHAGVLVGGWWEDNTRKDRASLPICYGLIVSLATDVVTDIYSSIAAQVNIPTEIRV